MKCEKTINTIAHQRVTKDRVQSSGSGARSKELEQFLPPHFYAWRPLFVPATHTGRRLETAPRASTLGDMNATRKSAILP